ncbi:hypothetical protein QBC41DRAFT_319495 [Cercophora samala]|uniref:Uncharacterized protein n=1 Tax=Cercophora samala TaxID=330535 RepID=A0AA39ZEI4_9PEZI|nr:hypothetical protein QBC41DRAFT_319495 [Cercophora samala]
MESLAASLYVVQLFSSIRLPKPRRFLPLFTPSCLALALAGVGRRSRVRFPNLWAQHRRRRPFIPRIPYPLNLWTSAGSVGIWCHWLDAMVPCLGVKLADLSHRLSLFTSIPCFCLRWPGIHLPWVQLTSWDIGSPHLCRLRVETTDVQELQDVHVCGRYMGSFALSTLFLCRLLLRLVRCIVTVLRFLGGQIVLFLFALFVC